VSLYLPIIFTSVPGRGDKSTPLNRGCILEIYLKPGNPENSSEAVNLFLI
jgi:hypothetical protein